jgi:predicted dehydrogenase
MVGCGETATAVHGPALARYARSRPDTELAACCARHLDRADVFRRAFGYSRCYADLDAMLDTERPDAVCLVAPVPATCELACRILAKGYPLLLEKPPGRSIVEIDRMIAASDRSGAPAMVAFNRRHTPLVVRLKRLLQEHCVSEHVRHIQVELTRVDRTTEEFANTAIHGIDIARFLTGSDYGHARFHYQPLPHRGPAIANVHLECVFLSGATGHLSFLPVSGRTMERVVVQADDHTFELRMPIMYVPGIPGRLRHFERDTLRLDALSSGDAVEANGFCGEITEFLDAIREGRRPAGDLRDARQSVAVMQCMRERREEYVAPT